MSTIYPLLPTSAERFIELNQALIFIVSRLSQRQFRLKQVAIGVESIEERVHPTFVAHICQLHPIAKRCDQILLFDAAFSHSLMCDQRVGHFRKSGFNRLLILDQGTLLLRFGQPNARAEAPGGENRLRDLRHEAPCGVWSAEEARELRA